MACALAARILDHFGLAYSVVVGHITWAVKAPSGPLPLRVPHIWLETEGGKVTDVCFPEQAHRAVRLVGTEIKLDEEAAPASYWSAAEAAEEAEATDEATTKPESWGLTPPGCTPVDVLAAAGSDLPGYIEQYCRRCPDPEGVRRQLATLLAQCTNLGEKEVVVAAAAAAAAAKPGDP